jgi:CheY-like chemotaxis protein
MQCGVTCSQTPGIVPQWTPHDGQQALTVLRRSLQPLVVLLDLGPPRLDGAELLHRTPGIDRGRRRSRRPQPHAGVLVTASYQTAPHSLRPCFDAWQSPVVRKSFDLDEVLAGAQGARQ